MSNTTRALTLGAAALALAGAAYAGTAAAHATPDSFIHAADWAGFNNDGGHWAELQLGYAICSNLNYYTEASVVRNLWLGSQMNYDDSQQFVDLAQAHLC